MSKKGLLDDQKRFVAALDPLFISFIFVRFLALLLPHSVSLLEVPFGYFLVYFPFRLFLFFSFAFFSLEEFSKVRVCPAPSLPLSLFLSLMTW